MIELPQVLQAAGPEFAGPNVSLRPEVSAEQVAAEAQLAFWGARKAGDEAAMQIARNQLTKAGGMTVKAMQLARTISAGR